MQKASAGPVLLPAGVAEAAFAARGVVEARDGFPADAGDGRDNHLCDAVAAVDGEGRLAEVGEDDADLAAIVGVDGARGCWRR